MKDFTDIFSSNKMIGSLLHFICSVLMICHIFKITFIFVKKSTIFSREKEVQKLLKHMSRRYPTINNFFVREKEGNMLYIKGHFLLNTKILLARYC